MTFPTAQDEEPLEENSPDRVARYSFDPPRPAREDAEPRVPFHRFERDSDRLDRQLPWGPVLAAAAAGFLIAIFGPCRSTDQEEAQQGQDLSSLQSELQSARDRVAQLESELSPAHESVGEAAAPEPAASEPAASKREPQTAPEPKREGRSELTSEQVVDRKEPAPISDPPPARSPDPEPSRTEPEPVALAEPQQVAAISVYDFPDPAAPIVRSTSRSGTPGVAVLQVLAPEQAGWTTEAQPTLYWHASDGKQFPGEFTLTREGEDEPVVRGRFSASDGAGIQRIELSQFGISLDEGASYRWSVTLVDLEHSGADRATGGIRRVAPPETLRAISDAAPGPEHLDALERAGLWYDALDLVTRSIERNPGAQNLVARRTAMLARVGIHRLSS